MREKLMKNMGYLIVFFDIAIYFIISYIFVDKFQVNILTIVVNGGLLFIGAIIANASLTKQGLLNGSDTEKYKETLRSHIEQKKIIYPKLNKLQCWLDEDYANLMKIGRTVYINGAGYDYEEVFTPKGKFINGFKIEKPKKLTYKKWQWPLVWLLRFFRWIFSDDWKIYRQKKSFIRKAKRYKISRLTVPHLLNIDSDRDPNDFGITERQYVKREGSSAIVSRLIFSTLLQSISFGFYGFNLVSFLQQMLSIVLIILTSIFAMFNAYSFIVKTHRRTIIMKINKMEEFDKSVEIGEIRQEQKKEVENGIHTALPEPIQSLLVEEIHREVEPGEEDYICGDAGSGI